MIALFCGEKEKKLTQGSQSGAQRSGEGAAARCAGLAENMHGDSALLRCGDWLALAKMLLTPKMFAEAWIR